jgi:hypothetical protein
MRSPSPPAIRACRGTQGARRRSGGLVLSPIGLFPNFVPGLGYLDELAVIPSAVLLVQRLLSDDVFADRRARR